MSHPPLEGLEVETTMALPLDGKGTLTGLTITPTKWRMRVT
jgi:hypothetical protein